MAKVIIGTKEFKTKASALSHFKKMLNDYNDGDVIIDEQDHKDLLALMDRYDSIRESVGEEPKGKGQISHFEKRKNFGDKWVSSSFWLVRKDGTETDFSIKAAISKAGMKNLERCFNDACRHAVIRDIVQIKLAKFQKQMNSNAEVKCEMTGKVVTWDECELDHDYPYFSVIVRDFRIANNLTPKIPSGVVTEDADGTFTATFVSKQMSDKFREYHKKRANLRLLSKGANAKLGQFAKIN
jgi:hypothetical protein